MFKMKEGHVHVLNRCLQPWEEGRCREGGVGLAAQAGAGAHG